MSRVDPAARFVCSTDRVCAGCGGAFHYRLRKLRPKKVDWNTPYPSAMAAAVEPPRADVVETHPCPHCGLIQPQMLAAEQQRWFRIAGGVCVLGIVAALVALRLEWAAQPLAAYVALACTAAAYLLARKAAALLPNDDMAANLVLARQEISEGVLIPGDAGASTAAPPPEVRRPRPAAYDRGLWLCIAAVLSAAAPILVPMALGWKVNAVGTPAVVGPGEVVSIPVPNSTGSATSILETSASAEAWNADEMKLPRGILLEAAPYGTCLPHSPEGFFQLVARSAAGFLPSGAKVRLPADPGLVGDALEMEVVIRARCETGFRPKVFRSDRTDQTTAIVQLSAPGAGGNYQVVLFGGMFGALVLGAWGCGVLASAAGKMLREGVE